MSRTDAVGPVTVFDVGGTHTRWAEWSAGGGLGPVHREPSPSVTTRPDLDVDGLRAALVTRMAAPVRPHGVAGVSFGAALDHRTGTVYASAPLWGAHEEPFDLLGALRAARPDVRWHVVNDVTAALRHLAGSPRARGYRKLLVATVSSGVACRTVDLRSGDVPVDGAGLQGEIGHLPARTALDGEPVELTCDCGRPGHLAAYSSGPGLARLAEVLRERRPARWAASALARRTGAGAPFDRALTDALDDGDEVAGILLDAATGPLADLARTALCLDPELDLLAFTGGVATGLGDRFATSLTGHLRREGLYLTGDRAPDWALRRIHVCAPGEADGLVGAGLAALAGEDVAPIVDDPAAVPA